MTGVPDHDSRGVATTEGQAVSRATADRPGRHEQRSLPRRQTGARWVATGEITDLPTWLARAIDDPEVATSETRFDVVLTERATRFGTLRTAVVPHAAGLDDDSFEDAVARAYDAVLDDVEHGRLLRAWNFIPRINDPSLRPGRDRYMVFNAGRRRAFADAFGHVDWFPVASGVGHAGDAMVVHLLQGEATVDPIDNPRQTPPEAYSARFGHPTPAFARAARVRWTSMEGLLVSGTASVVGEASHHDGSIEAQIDETLHNLEIVVDRGWPGLTPAALEDWLVYLPEPTHAELVRDAVARRWPDASPRLLFRGQRLCRPELLVEIECAGVRPIEDAAG